VCVFVWIWCTETMLVLAVLRCIVGGYVSEHTLVSLNIAFQIALHQTSAKLYGAATSSYLLYSSLPRKRK
jgi:hypothetical protein